MPNILTRNPFHHHHNHNHSGSNIDNYANGVNGSTQDANDTSSMFSEATGTASTIDNDNGKRRKPFLNFMNVGSSNVGQTTSNDSDTQSSVLELKRFLRPSLLHNDTNRSGFFSGSKKKEIKRPMSPGSPVSPQNMTTFTTIRVMRFIHKQLSHHPLTPFFHWLTLPVSTKTTLF